MTMQRKGRVHGSLKVMPFGYKNSLHHTIPCCLPWTLIDVKVPQSTHNNTEEH